MLGPFSSHVRFFAFGSFRFGRSIGLIGLESMPQPMAYSVSICLMLNFQTPMTGVGGRCVVVWYFRVSILDVIV